MAIEDDLSALMPKPPPPRPARREAAIEAALRRFEGQQEEAPRTAEARPAPASRGSSRPQLAALASIALAVMISVPIWWSQKGQIDEVIPQITAVEPAVRAPQRPDTPGAAGAERERAPPALPEPDRSRPSAPGVAPAPAPVSAVSPSSAQPSGNALARRAPPPPPAPAARQPASRAAADERIVVTGSRVTRPNLESNSPVVSVDEDFLRQSGTPAVGQQLNKLPQFVVAQGPSASGSCTILDQHRDLRACRDFADPAAPGASGRAATLLGEGLTLAWQGELDRAIGAFDRAIRADPDLAIAYLNRGLAWQAKGDNRRALADLDRAVARDRNGARGYYHRSLLHRAMGDTARADADARRAAELDPGYRAVRP